MPPPVHHAALPRRRYAAAAALVAASVHGGVAGQPVPAPPSGVSEVPGLSAPDAPPGAQALPPVAGNEADAEVLRRWQSHTGQAAWTEEAASAEFHGSAALDVYGNRVRSPSGNPALTGQRPGDFGRLLLQGDLRSTTADGDVTYVQGVGSASDDRGVLPRYPSLVNSFQAGRVGTGYQIVAGDVVGNFSSLGSNLGLRGLLAAREHDAFTATAFAGSVAESWEALALRTARDGQPARTRYVRDAYGLKIDWRINATWSAFATAQGWDDRPQSAQPLYAQPTTRGSTVTAGGRYATLEGQWVLEGASSRQRDLATGKPARGNGVVVDGNQRFGDFGVRGGWHNLEAGFGTLAPYLAPGVREWYVGGDWNITPALLASVDLRHGLSRIPVAATIPGSAQPLPTPVSGTPVEVPVIEILQDTANARLSYAPSAMPGLVLNAFALRSKNQDALRNESTNLQTQLGAGYAFGLWNLQLSVTDGASRTPVAPQADSDMRQWQLGLGRSLSGEAGLGGQPAWTLMAQGFVSGFGQTLLGTGARTRNRVAGLTVTWLAQATTSVSSTFQYQTTEQPLAGRPTLNTRSLSLDASHAFTPQWQGKFYARLNKRNYGDLLLQTDDRVLGAQLAYLW